MKEYIKLGDMEIRINRNPSLWNTNDIVRNKRCTVTIIPITDLPIDTKQNKAGIVLNKKSLEKRLDKFTNYKLMTAKDILRDAKFINGNLNYKLNVDR